MPQQGGFTTAQKTGHHDDGAFALGTHRHLALITETSTTQGLYKPWIKGIERTAEQLCHRWPQCPQVRHHLRTAFAIAEHVVPILPIVETQAIVAEDIVQDLRPVLPISAALTFAVTTGRCDRLASLLPATIRPVSFYEQRL
jgi:hypothetical protein